MGTLNGSATTKDGFRSSLGVLVTQLFAEVKERTNYRSIKDPNTVPEHYAFDAC